MMRRPLVALIQIYQRFLSPLKLQPTCRFQPTCSSYAIGAVSEWGTVIGSILTLWRILRCNPFGRGGMDPVPMRIEKPRVVNRKFFAYDDKKYLSLFPAPYCVLFPLSSKDHDSLTVEK